MLLVENLREYIALNLSHYILFPCNVKLCGRRIGTKFDKNNFAVTQSNYLTKVVNVYILYELVACPRSPINNFIFKNCLFGRTSVVNTTDKEKYKYSA